VGRETSDSAMPSLKTHPANQVTAIYKVAVATCERLEKLASNIEALRQSMERNRIVDHITVSSSK
jgi:hypothetical protein